MKPDDPNIEALLKTQIALTRILIKEMRELWKAGIISRRVEVATNDMDEAFKHFDRGWARVARIFRRSGVKL